MVVGEEGGNIITSKLVVEDLKSCYILFECPRCGAVKRVNDWDLKRGYCLIVKSKGSPIKERNFCVMDNADSFPFNTRKKILQKLIIRGKPRWFRKIQGIDYDGELPKI